MASPDVLVQAVQVDDRSPATILFGNWEYIAEETLQVCSRFCGFLLQKLLDLIPVASCRHAMMSCLAFAASLCPPALKPIVTDEDQAYMNTPKVTLLKYHLQHCDILPVNRMVILPRMLRYSFSIIPHFKEVL